MISSVRRLHEFNLWWWICCLLRLNLVWHIRVPEKLTHCLQEFQLNTLVCCCNCVCNYVNRGQSVYGKYARKQIRPYRLYPPLDFRELFSSLPCANHSQFQTFWNFYESNLIRLEIGCFWYSSDSLPFTYYILQTALLNLDESVLDMDQVENLIKICPTKEEVDMLKVHFCWVTINSLVFWMRVSKIDLANKIKHFMLSRSLSTPVTPCIFREIFGPKSWYIWIYADCPCFCCTGWWGTKFRQFWAGMRKRSNSSSTSTHNFWCKLLALNQW